jgi:hypothetical protein
LVPHCPRENNPRITIILVTEISIRRKHYNKNEYGIDGIHDCAAIGYPGFLTKSSIQKTEHLAKPTVIDRVEAVRNHLTWAMDWKGERLGIVETSALHQLFQRNSFF